MCVDLSDLQRLVLISLLVLLDNSLLGFNRFNSYEEFFSIRMQENESLPALASRVEAKMAEVKALRPKSFTLEQLYDELTVMAMVRSLGDDYSSFVSTLLMQDSLEKKKVLAAFHSEELQRKKRCAPEALESANRGMTKR